MKYVHQNFQRGLHFHVFWLNSNHSKESKIYRRDIIVEDLEHVKAPKNQKLLSNHFYYQQTNLLQLMEQHWKYRVYRILTRYLGNIKYIIHFLTTYLGTWNGFHIRRSICFGQGIIVLAYIYVSHKMTIKLPTIYEYVQSPFRK